jgi:hypothetical protein
MENAPNATRVQVIKSLQSSISKSEKALTQMTLKGANTTLLEKRLAALRIGLAVLETVWNQSPHHYNRDELRAARGVLAGLLPGIESIQAKSPEGTPPEFRGHHTQFMLTFRISAAGSLDG